MNTIADVAKALRVAIQDKRIQQVRGPFVLVIGLNAPVRVCATAAVVIETGLPIDDWVKIDAQFIISGWPVFLTTVRHPILSSPLSLFAVIADLNDGYGWTWDRIASWLEEIDAA